MCRCPNAPVVYCMLAHCVCIPLMNTFCAYRYWTLRAYCYCIEHKSSAVLWETLNNLEVNIYTREHSHTQWTMVLFQVLQFIIAFIENFSSYHTLCPVFSNTFLFNYSVTVWVILLHALIQVVSNARCSVFTRAFFWALCSRLCPFSCSFCLFCTTLSLNCRD